MILRQRVQLWAVLLVSLVIAILTVACGGSKANTKTDAAASPTPAPVDVTTASAISRQLPRYFEATGSLAADEQTDVAPTVAGKVVEIGVDLGSYVKRGAMLVRLDDRDNRLRLEQAQAVLTQSQAAVRQAEERVGLRSGQAFDVVRVPDVASARVALELAEKQLQRYEHLVESGDVSRANYDQQKAQRDQLQQQYQVAIEQARQNYAGVVTARAAVAAAQNQVDQARKSIADTVVLAPINGFVADRPANLGEYMSTSSKIATIVKTNPLRVRIDIPEQAVRDVQVGQTVSVNVSSFPDHAFSGRIARISPNVTATSRTMTVEAEVENGNNQLKPGGFATVRILQSQSEAAVLVPARAVRTDSEASRVFVVKDGHVEQRLVQLGQTEGDLVEIKTGVSPDEQVATSNVDQLNDGSSVRQ